MQITIPLKRPKLLPGSVPSIFPYPRNVKVETEEKIDTDPNVRKLRNRRLYNVGILKRNRVKKLNEKTGRY